MFVKSETAEKNVNALAQYLEIAANDVETTKWDFLEAESNEYLVLTNSEADEKVKEDIMNSLWAFNSSFILEQCELPYELEDAFKSWQGDKCEACNDALEKLIDKCCGIDEFVRSAVSADGRGHFIAGYDFEENETTYEGETFYIYRV